MELLIRCVLRGLTLVAAGAISVVQASAGPASADSSWAPRIAWSRRVVSAPACAPVLSGDTLWIAGIDRKIRSLDVETGRRHWRRSVPGRIALPPLPSGDRLLVALGSPDPSVIALSRHDGKQQWARPARAVPVALARSGGLACVATARGELIAIDPEDGREVWCLDLETTLAGMTAAEGALFVLGRLDSLWCKEAVTGAPRWSVLVGEPHAAPPVAVSGAVLRLSYAGDLVQHDAATGAEIRRTRLTAPQIAPARADGEGAVATVAGGGEMEILRVETGEIERTLQWKETASAGAQAWGPWWVVPSQKGTVRSAARSGGTAAWALSFDAPLAQPPAVGPDRIVFVDDRGHVVVYRLGERS